MDWCHPPFALKALLAGLGEALAQGADMPVGLEASYRSHVLTFAAIDSARTGATVTFAPAASGT